MHCIAGLMPIHWLKNHKSGRKNWTRKISTEMPRKWVNRRCEQEQKKIAHKWTHTQHQWDGIREPTNVQKKKNYSYARHHSASIFFLASKSLLFLSLLNTRSLLPRALSLSSLFNFFSAYTSTFCSIQSFNFYLQLINIVDLLRISQVLHIFEYGQMLCFLSNAPTEYASHA